MRATAALQNVAGSGPHLQGLLHRVGDAGLRRLEANARHRLLEQVAVLRAVDGWQLRAQQLNIVLVQRAVLWTETPQVTM